MDATNDHSKNGHRGTSTRRMVLKTACIAGVGLAASSSSISGRGVDRGETGSEEWVVGGAIATGPSTGETDPPAVASHEITGCTTITSAGTYEVVSDINTTAAMPCIDIRADDVTLRGNDNELNGDGSGIGVGTNVGATSFEGIPERTNIVVENLRLTNFGTAVQFNKVREGRIANVTARRNSTCVEFHFASSFITLRNSTFAQSGVGFQTRGDPDVWGGSASNVLEHNRIESNGVGISLGHGTFGHEFVRNRIVGNESGARHSGLDTSGHTYRRNVICSNPTVGILNFDMPAAGGIPAFEDVVEATDNYWGAANGPSSFDDPASAFTDPVTGAPADGDGDAISESLDPGVANVHFDPYLGSAPAGAGLE